MKKIALIVFLILGLKSYSCNIYDTINQTICPEDSFLFNGIYLKTAGTYYDTFNISLGCDTFRTLNLSVHPAIPNTFVVDSFCQGYGYAYNSKVFTFAGFYWDTLNSSNGCDSMIFLSLSFKNRPVVVYPTIDTFCIRDTVYFQGKQYKYNTQGNKTIRDTMFGAAMNGCDSINIRAVFIRNNNTSFGGTRYACRNMPFIFGDSIFICPTPMPGGFNFKSVVLRNRFTCDSTVTFNLVWRDTSTTTINRTTCSNQPYFFNGEWLGTGITATTTIYRRDTLTQTVNGPGGNTARCDSFINLVLVVYPAKYTTIDTSLCDNHTYFFKGKFEKNPGTYLDTLLTVDNCDSFVTLNILATRLTSRYTYYRKFCSNETVLFNGVNIDQPGTYNDTLVNAVGCDSFLTMVLVKDTVNQTTLNIGICSYDSFYFNGQYLKTAGTYSMTVKNNNKCDSIVTLNLTIYPFRTVTLVKSVLNYIKTDSGYSSYFWYFNDFRQLNTTGHTIATNAIGNYYVIAQDSNYCKFKSNVYVHNPAGIIANNANEIKVYPIPASNLLHIESNTPFDKNTNVYVYNIEGKVVITQKVIGKSSKLFIDLSSVMKGLYILKIESDNQTIERRIEKQ